MGDSYNPYDPDFYRDTADQLRKERKERGEYARACEVWTGRVDPEFGAVACGKDAVTRVVDDASGGGMWVCGEHAEELTR